ncbi:MAG: hypothetical protein M1839_002370 [Geoglossum umbratile]|nr:MAG: hypothetical protein M1839_002370 [Geoglossum umbratile]
MHPPTAGVGVLCIDGGGARGVVPLKLMKRIQDRIGLPIPFQTLFKVAFGISSGGLIVLAMFMNGWSIDESTETFEKLAKLAFKRRRVLDIPLLSRVQEFVVSYLFDGIYPAKNIEAALKEVPELACLSLRSVNRRVAYLLIIMVWEYGTRTKGTMSYSLKMDMEEYHFGKCK